jgi:hypothetical protein
MKYKVVHDYLSYWYGFPMLIAAGSVGEWFEDGNCYTFSPTVNYRGNDYTPCVHKWAVEAWHDFFEAAK